MDMVLKAGKGQPLYLGVRIEGLSWILRTGRLERKDLNVKEVVPKRYTEKGEDTSEESKSVLAGPGCICVCGDSEKRMRKTKCGATLCSKCLDTVHIHCRICHEAEPTPQGIQGKMSYSRLHISVPGYKKDYAIKVTYCIPDGIQEVSHQF